jgi:phosphoadenosine phosphosulfate reductase
MLSGEVNMEFERFENMDVWNILRWARDEFKDEVAFASSFGAEDVVLIDILYKIYYEKNLKPRIFTLDTGRLPQETYNVIEEIMEKYKIEIDFYFPDYREVEEMEKKYGPNLFYKSIELRKLCCNIRKVKVLGRALKGYRAWITGLRREQSITRVDIKKVEIDNAHNGIIKINPIADWKVEDVWKYIRENNVPYNKLHDKNYPSIGCEPCTRAVNPGEDIRAGRWWWESPEYKECGLHPSRRR